MAFDWKEGEAREGGCQCGAVRYRISARPKALVACHCSECQRQSGSAFALSLIVAESGFVVLQGALGDFTRQTDSGRTLRCVFCVGCGTRIYHVPTYAPGIINVRAGTLDRTSDLVPDAHTWTRSKQPWVEIPDGVPTFETQPIHIALE